jgi:hypothetical protein
VEFRGPPVFRRGIRSDHQTVEPSGWRQRRVGAPVCNRASLARRASAGLLCPANQTGMKRCFLNLILSASVMAACVGCSAGGHLYSLGTLNVPTVFDHFWSSSQGYYIGQCRVPFDAQGREIHEDQRKVAHWRTFTEVGVPRHCWYIRGPIWTTCLMLCTAAGAALISVQWAASSYLRRFPHEERGA